MSLKDKICAYKNDVHTVEELRQLELLQRIRIDRKIQKSVIKKNIDNNKDVGQKNTEQNKRTGEKMGAD